MEKWTLNNVPDLTGELIVVTGGNSGLGFESVKAFAAKGADVILASRSREKGEAAKNEILNSIGDANIKVMQLDLADLNSIREFADRFKNKYDRLDILMNNAGIMTSPYHLTKDGFEGQIGTNHLGHFALTGLLMDLVKSTPKSRIVNISSNAHKAGKMDFNNLLFENGKGYSPLRAYSRSKLANLLFTYELQRRFERSGIKTIAVAAHPGAANSNLDRYISDKWYYKVLFPLAKLYIQTQADGALSQIRAAVDPDVKGGEYYGPSRFRETIGPPIRVKSTRASHNEKDALKLWEISEKLTGVNYLDQT